VFEGRRQISHHFGGWKQSPANTKVRSYPDVSCYRLMHSPNVCNYSSRFVLGLLSILFFLFPFLLPCLFFPSLFFSFRFSFLFFISFSF
jgi:hypothetical protein